MSKRNRRRRKIRAAAKATGRIIGMTSPVQIEAAESGEDGQPKGPAKFTSNFYNGGALSIAGWDLPVVIDLAGTKESNVLVANLDHDKTKRVGNFLIANDGRSLVANGTASAATAHRDEVINSARDGYHWQSSIEANAIRVERVKKGQTAQANGRTFAGPIDIARESIVQGFGFVSHGADDNTTVSIAASADTHSERKMKAEVRAWATETLLLDVDELTDEQVAALEANYAGQNAPPPKSDPDLKTGFEKMKAEKERSEQITDIALRACENAPRMQMEGIQEMAQEAIDGNWTVTDFKLKLIEAGTMGGNLVHAPQSRDPKLTNTVLEAAICQAGGMSAERLDKHFSDQELQAAHDRFKGSIGLNQLLMLGARANGYRSDYEAKITIEAQRAAFGMTAPNIRASGFSTISISTITSNVANKFLRMGWDFVEQAWALISATRSVSDFKQITTVSLTGGNEFEKVGGTGMIPHGELGEEVYTNKADTYAKMLAITRTDIINDDLGALTSAPQRLGRGGALKMNDIFWAKFLDNGTFFTSARGNVSETLGELDAAGNGLAAAEEIFVQQTDPDGNPLGAEPRILLTPVPLKNTARRLMESDKLKGNTDEVDANIWQGRFQTVSSRYMTNAKYTGNSAIAWYLLADPMDLPVIEVVALNGRVEPVVETADADFNVLGIQMRGYSDVGVELQEYRGGVRADGTNT